MMTNILQDSTVTAFVGGILKFNSELNKWKAEFPRPLDVYYSIESVITKNDIFKYATDQKTYPVLGRNDIVTEDVLKTECYIENLTESYIEGNPVFVSVTKDLSRNYNYEKGEGIYIEAYFPCIEKINLTLK